MENDLEIRQNVVPFELLHASRSLAAQDLQDTALHSDSVIVVMGSEQALFSYNGSFTNPANRNTFFVTRFLLTYFDRFVHHAVSFLDEEHFPAV